MKRDGQKTPAVVNGLAQLAEATAGVLQKFFHESARRHRLPPNVADAIYREMITETLARVEAEQQRAIANSKAALKSQWGADFDTKYARARGAIDLFGLSEDDAVLMGNPEIFEKLSVAGARLADDPVPLNQDGDDAMNNDARPLEEVMFERGRFAADADFMEAFGDPRHPRHAERKAQWDANIAREIAAKAPAPKMAGRPIEQIRADINKLKTDAEFGRTLGRELHPNEPNYRQYADAKAKWDGLFAEMANAEGGTGQKLLRSIDSVRADMDRLTRDPEFQRVMKDPALPQSHPDYHRHAEMTAKWDGLNTEAANASPSTTGSGS